MSDFPQRILHIDDDATDRTLVSAALDDIDGLKVESYNGGDEALDHIKDYQPDLILLDLRMPKKDGPTTLQAIREIDGFAEIPAVFITGVEKVTMLDEYKRLGVLGVIHKPVNPPLLASEITKLWQNRPDD